MRLFSTIHPNLKIEFGHRTSGKIQLLQEKNSAFPFVKLNINQM